MSELTLKQMLELRAAGRSNREIAVAAGISHSAVNKRLKAADKAAAGPKSFKDRVEDSIDVETLSNAQKVALYRTTTKSRQRGKPEERDEQEYVERYAGKSLLSIDGVEVPGPTEEECRAFYRTVHDSTWQPPDLFGYLTIPCEVCGKPKACRNYPVCDDCTPDEEEQHEA